MKKILYLFLIAMLFSSCAKQTLVTPQAPAQQAPKQTQAPKPKTIQTQQETPKMKAIIETSLGTIKVDLLPENAPKTVQNFTDLAEGKKTGKKFYDGLTFHRVIPDFMIQTGCPLGTGTGGPGYKFEDEIDPSLKFTQGGILAMANAGPNTNGSQFFITETATPWLNGNHTIFGKVTEGMDVVKKIARVETDFSDKPVEPVLIKKITIERK
jgi:peptidyl-prolyl cis-trans isomerase A (cyclophilin A)